MSDQVTNSFIEALRALEQDKDVEPLAALYSEEAVVGNVVAPGRFHGKDGARRFWTEYRGTFGQVASEFRNVIVSDNRAALEWTTDGTGFDGGPVRYSGVTLLEITENAISRSIAYYDPHSLGHQIEPAQ